MESSSSSLSFDRVAGWGAIGVGLGGIAYSIAFLIFLHDGARGAKIANSVILLAGGLVASMVLMVLYDRLRLLDPLWALWGLIIGTAGSIASALHGGFDLAVALKRLPAPEVSQVDARGLATFALIAIGMAIMATLLTRDARYPRRLGRLGQVAAAGLFLVYIGRITLYNPKRPILLVLLVLVGFILNPAWYIWLGRLLTRTDRPAATVASASADRARPLSRLPGGG